MKKTLYISLCLFFIIVFFYIYYSLKDKDLKEDLICTDIIINMGDAHTWSDEYIIIPRLGSGSTMRCKKGSLIRITK